MGGNEKIGLVARGKSLFTESGALPYPVDSRIVHVEGDTLNHDVFRLWLSWIHGALPQPRIPIPRLFGYISASEFDDYQDGVVVIAGFANHAWALVDEFAGPGIERVDINLGKTGMPHVFKQGISGTTTPTSGTVKEGEPMNDCRRPPAREPAVRGDLRLLFHSHTAGS